MKSTHFPSHPSEELSSAKPNKNQLAPLPHLAETLALEGVAALANALPTPTGFQPATPPPPSVAAILACFERTHRPRVELCARLSAVLTRAATRSSPWHTLLSYYLLPRTPALLYEEFALSAAVLHHLPPRGGVGWQQGRFWQRKRVGGVVQRARATVRCVGLWTGRQIELARVLLACCRPLPARYYPLLARGRLLLLAVRREAEQRRPLVEQRLQAAHSALGSRPGLQLAVGAVGLYGGLCLLGQCGGWAVRLLVFVASGPAAARTVGVGVYCIPGSRYAVVH